jgi:nucleoside 2-deoxyribosyltransferase
MKIYIAAPWKDKALMNERAKPFEDAGHTITWKWWETDNIPEGADRDGELKEQAKNDHNGVRKADALVLFNTAKSEGKAVEQGIAIERGIPIVAIGTLGDGTSFNVFHYLKYYEWVNSVNEAISALSML